MRYRTLGIIFNIMSYVPLVLPMYKLRFADEPGYGLIVRGYNLVEFSAWGGLLLIMPLILTALIHMGIKNSGKNALLIMFTMLNTVTAYNAFRAADRWVRAINEAFVLFKPYILLYCFFMLVAVVCLFVHNYKYYDYTTV